MLRPFFLLTGLVLALNQNWLLPFSEHLQILVFLGGILIVGLPHGAADLLVSKKESLDEIKAFSYNKFFFNYLIRIVLFFSLIALFPLIGIFVFVLIAAYHFGETDLYHFNTNTVSGAFFLVSYGLIIINITLLAHFDEVKPLLFIFDSVRKQASFISLIDHYRFLILSLSVLLFFGSAFIYFLVNGPGGQFRGQFLINFCLLAFILYNLPMLLGFTFYFVLWHSVLSLKNIVTYLRKDNQFSLVSIVKQIGVYSSIASAGIIFVGFCGFKFGSHNTLIISIFMGLAVLTAPHMQIMHLMYNRIRMKNNQIISV
jgi:Brp/Blh family beta-carotene 15,15'-monooxygenase